MNDPKNANRDSKKLQLTRNTVKNLRVRSGFQTGLLNAVNGGGSTTTSTGGPGHARCTHSDV
jgi:hypothetical protein